MNNQSKKIGIIGAMPCEVEPLIAQMENAQTLTVGSITFTQGFLCGKQTVIAICGIGKVFAAMCAQTMILHFGVGIIVNVGVAGSLCDELRIGDIALATNTVQHDMDTSPIGDPVGLISGINLVYLPCSERLCDLLALCIQAQGVHFVRGTVASGDVFVASPAQRARITQNFDAVACEMEGSAICQVCYANGVEVGILRAISDNCNDPSTMDYQTFRDSSARVGCRILLDFMSRI